MIPRLYVDGHLATGAAAPLAPDQAHYLRNVLRREAGASLKLFNERDGEFEAVLQTITKKGAVAALGDRVRAPIESPHIVLWFAPVKRTPTEMIIQKGTELGVSIFQPVMTARTNADRLKVDRLQSIALEAAEQSGRLSVPAVRQPMKLDKALDAQRENSTLIYCDEAGDDPGAEWGGAEGRAAPMLEVLRQNTDDDVTVLIGPEGGFSPDERDKIRAQPGVAPVTLGPRILRADTAAIAALTLWQAARGDWRYSS